MSCKDKEVLIKLFMKPRKSDIGVYAMANKLSERGASKKNIKEEIKYTYRKLYRK